LSQPAHALASNEGIVVKPALRAAADVAARIEDIEPVTLDRFGVVDRRFGFEDGLVHLEFAEVRGLVTEPLQG
jgi:hypothetical protein